MQGKARRMPFCMCWNCLDHNACLHAAWCDVDLNSLFLMFVYRLVQEPGTLVVLLPNAFHSWVSTGFSIHESVALAPWDCLGAGCDAERSCRQQHHPTPVSQTELLVTLVSSTWEALYCA